MQKKFLSLVLMLIAVINIFAYDFESNGIYYNILSKENRTCTVTSQPNTTGKKYTGTIVIPSTVQDNNGEDYTVTGIGNYAFMDCVKLQSIVLPNTIQEVGYRAHPIKSVASLPKYQRYTIEKERYVPNSTQLASKCLKLGVE